MPRNLSDSTNVDPKTVEGFGDEWKRFDQSQLPHDERDRRFAEYFACFPMEALRDTAVGADFGCGTGRWAHNVAPKVKRLYCVDPSEALVVARSALSQYRSCVFVDASLDSLPTEIDALDFGYSLGVLHHIPDPRAALRHCVERLKPGAPFLVYVYYAFDHRPRWFKALWLLSNVLRRGVSKAPKPVRYLISQAIAVSVYLPLTQAARCGEWFGFDVKHWPLSYYRNTSFYSMRTDALDRFGTRLEWRFARPELEAMMRDCGLDNIQFSNQAPFWCACGTRVS